jgi:serine/threonine-protein kinase
VGGENERFGLAGTSLEQRCRVQSVVAEGGFGVVYDAVHLGLETRVAFKVLKVPMEMSADGRAAFVDKFRLEAKTMARIRHPNIVVPTQGGLRLNVGGAS